MEKTKQTARLSTGGKAPRKQLASKAARISRADQDAQETMMWKLSNQKDIKKLFKTTGGSHRYPYHVWVLLQLRKYDLDWHEMFRRFGLQIPVHLDARGDRGVLIDEPSRVGLTESLDDHRTYDRVGMKAWDIESICFEDGKYVAVSQQDKSKHVILLYTLQVCSGARTFEHVITDEKFYVNGHDRISAYVLVDAWCQNHPGRWLAMSVSGARPASSSASLFHLPRLRGTPYQDNTNLCIPAAICNSVHLYGAPRLASNYWGHFKDNAALFGRHDRLPRRIRNLRDANKHPKQNEVVLKHLFGTIPTLDRLLSIWS
ncbi:unnamed protein product [Chondrus crispus]|uniref:Uncharacterized protein n=1 Tax=Chondrus crispus TaxID=2769 RepID=S0F3W4_CHOCR|nr:unnamed protein product [Chondrus crispus]CDF77538.1 unnamed protein product [Chondrus crispus]|eukprot:XP_005717322.1 unnamed protein product [Chondrus crispus]